MGDEALRPTSARRRSGSVRGAASGPACAFASFRLGHDQEETRHKWRTLWEQATTPGPGPTTLPQDDSVFERDVTYPDGTVVPAGERFDKTWRIRNTGSVHWRDRYR
ncbi:hypothetical protein GCM10020001_076810 [Nonomuraea salmonea]